MHNSNHNTRLLHKIKDLVEDGIFSNMLLTVGISTSVVTIAVCIFDNYYNKLEALVQQSNSGSVITDTVSSEIDGSSSNHLEELYDRFKNDVYTQSDNYKPFIDYNMARSWVQKNGTDLTKHLLNTLLSKTIMRLYGSVSVYGVCASTIELSEGCFSTISEECKAALFKYNWKNTSLLTYVSVINYLINDERRESYPILDK